MKKPSTIPVVLSVEVVEKLLNSFTSFKGLLQSVAKCFGESTNEMLAQGWGRLDVRFRI